MKDYSTKELIFIAFFWILCVVLGGMIGYISENTKNSKTYDVYYEYDIHTTYTSIHDCDKTYYWVNIDTIPVDTIYKQRH